jgi:pimeloyl-ACP methyl ester carboxylesterase
MPQPASDNPLKHLRASDIRGIAQLASQATVGVTSITEGVHLSVLGTLGIPGNKVAGRTSGLTGLVYASVRTVTHLVSKGLDVALARLQPLFELLDGDKPETPGREAALAILNGIMGDRLVASGNTFALPMSLYYQGRPLDLEATAPVIGARAKVLLLIHGLCMSELQWHAGHKTPGTDHGKALSTGFGYTPVYLRYNSGLHISQNGRELASQLEQLSSHWPCEIEEFTVLAHSMGGLVIRSAVHYARQQGLAWPSRLKSIVFLGTPHHGAPLERVGNWVDALVGSTPYTRPFNALGRIRSAGITDLRHGYLLDSDWQGRDRFALELDKRRTLAMPEGVNCYAIAATTGDKRGALADRFLGDGLVPVNSALGQHTQTGKAPGFPDSHQWISYSTNHMELLSRPEVTRKIAQWLELESHAR